MSFPCYVYKILISSDDLDEVKAIERAVYEFNGENFDSKILYLPIIHDDNYNLMTPIDIKIYIFCKDMKIIDGKGIARRISEIEIMISQKSICAVYIHNNFMQNKNNKEFNILYEKFNEWGSSNNCMVAGYEVRFELLQKTKNFLSHHHSEIKLFLANQLSALANRLKFSASEYCLFAAEVPDCANRLYKQEFEKKQLPIINDLKNGIYSYLKSAEKLDYVNRKETVMNLMGIFDLLNKNWSHHPLLIEIAGDESAELVARLNGMDKSTGYHITEQSEIIKLIEKLFRNTLKELIATSIQSSHPELLQYRKYWDNSKVAQTFKVLNKKFVDRGGELTRIYFVDSFRLCVNELWFKDMVSMISEGEYPSIYIDEIDRTLIDHYKDYGVYTHEHVPGETADYVLDAPRGNNDNKDLFVTLIATSEQCLDRKRDFARSIANKLPLRRLARYHANNKSCRNYYGEGNINALFERHVLLRNLQPLDNPDKPLYSGVRRFIRKYDREYSWNIISYIDLNHTGCDRIIYVGDTYDNDGGIIRNLQRKYSVKGFICNPKLGLDNILFNDVLFAVDWQELTTFHNQIANQITSSTLAIFDIDQTLWAARGINEIPIDQSRRDAITKILECYAGSSPRFATIYKASDLIYSEIKDVHYNLLTLDNEDFKAAITVFLAINAFTLSPVPNKRFDSFALAPVNCEASIMLFMKQYVPTIPTIENGKDGMLKFLHDAKDAMDREAFDKFVNESNIDAKGLIRLADDIMRSITRDHAVCFREFRNKELEATLKLAVPPKEIDESTPKKALMLNKAAWDYAMMLKRRRVPLLALSDRPDESTYQGSASLLDTPMMIYGDDISALLEGQ
ncbi:MAG: hypothetical protein HQM03_19255 [Magnetococcales bacterium]|nr:hypothetical protein [Magnetococcales bacterium]